jgi:dihydropteroate synthase
MRDMKIDLPRGRSMPLDRTRIMGILNITGDSFYGASRLSGVEESVGAALKMVKEGADILDIGAESTRPGSLAVPMDKEISSLIPVVDAVRRALPDVPISVDTRRAETARMSLDAGADIINDVSGLELPDEAPRMLKLLSETKAPYVLMHTKGTPDVMQISPHYDDFLRELMAFFEGKIALLEDAGISRDRIILDPGVGFGKRTNDNVDILANIGALREFGLPLLIGASRKGFIGRVLAHAGLESSISPEDCLEGTIAVSAVCAMERVEIVRVHDVKENKRAVEVAGAIRARGHG